VSILSDSSILAAIEDGLIVIDPFDLAQLGGNSYDVRLGAVLRIHDGALVMDAARENLQPWAAVVRAAAPRGRDEEPSS